MLDRKLAVMNAAATPHTLSPEGNRILVDITGSAAVNMPSAGQIVPIPPRRRLSHS